MRRSAAAGLAGAGIFGLVDALLVAGPLGVRGGGLAVLVLAGVLTLGVCGAAFAAAVHAWRADERGARSLALGLVVGVVLWTAAGTRAGRIQVGTVAPDAPNVLLISLDTARADRFGTAAVDTPAWDRLAAQGVVFERATSQVPVTGPSHTTLLSGRTPWETGLLFNARPVPTDAPWLPEQLAAEGYATGAFVSVWVLDHSLGFDRGFAVFDDDLAMRGGLDRLVVPGLLLGRRGVERRGDATVERAIDWLKLQEAPWFCWVHLFDPHGPYAPPPPWSERYYRGSNPRDPANRSMDGVGPVPTFMERQLDGITDLDWVLAQYDGEIAYADHQVLRLLEWLRRSGQHENTVVILVADHGEGLGEHGEWFKHGGRLYAHDVAVPLVMRGPGIAPGRVHEPVELTDVAPTVRGLVGLSPDGRTLLDEPRRWARSIAWDEEADAGRDLRIYGVHGAAGSCVVDDLGQTRFVETEGTEDPCAAALEVRALAGSGEAPAAIGEQDRAALEALGYVEP